MLFPLDYTIADVEDILPPGNYLLDVVDKSGEPLGVTIGLALGMPRNAGTVESDNENSAPSVVPTMLPATTSDVRLVLEANVRATQMAFIHNQRTLEIGLRMAETLRDGVQVLANAQADWIKSVSSARGFFRNGGPLPTPVEVKQLTVNTGGGEVDNNGGDEGGGGAPDDSRDGDGGYGDVDDGHDTSTTRAHWSEQFLPIVNQVAMQVMPAINAWCAKQMSDARGRSAGGRRNATDDPAVVEASAEEQADQDHAAKLAAAIAAASSDGPGLNVVKLLQLLPQRTAAKLMQVQGALSADERVDAMQILRGYSAAGVSDLLGVFDAASVEQCTGFLRDLVTEWRAMRAARAARAKAPPPDSGGPGDGSGGGGDGPTEPR